MPGKRIFTIGAMLDEVGAKHAGKEAIVFSGKRLSYGNLLEQVNRLAQGLLSLGIEKGERVALWMPNMPEWIMVKYACAKIGAILVPLNTRYQPHEVEYIIRQSESNALIILERFQKIDFLDFLLEMCPELRFGGPGRVRSEKFPELRNVIVMGENIPKGTFSFSELMLAFSPNLQEKLMVRQNSIHPEDVVNIIYTSGTTAFPKGVMLCHGPILRNYRIRCDELGITSEDRFPLILPFCHIAGALGGVLSCTMYGATMLPLPIFDPEQLFQLIEEEKATIFHGVTTIFNSLLSHPKLSLYDLSSLRAGTIFSGPYPVDLIKNIVEKLHIKRLRTGYGLTESTNGLISVTTGEDPLEIVASALGKWNRTDVEMKIVDPTTGNSLPPGQSGEFCIRGFLVMKGYYKNPVETKAAVDSEGWLHTGDLCEIGKDGYIFIRGRLKDMIKTSGFNVSSQEVEQLLRQHPKVQEVAVVGFPDPVLTEIIVAFIQLKDGQIGISQQEIVDFCRGKIASYKIPKMVKTIKEFPRNSSDRIQKFKLREQRSESESKGISG